MCSSHAKKKHGSGKAIAVKAEVMELPVVMEEGDVDADVIPSDNDDELAQSPAKRQKPCPETPSTSAVPVVTPTPPPPLMQLPVLFEVDDGDAIPPEDNGLEQPSTTQPPTSPLPQVVHIVRADGIEF